MKNKVLIMLLLFSITVSAQKINPYFGAEYLIDYSYTYVKPIDFGNLHDLRVVNDNIPDVPMFNIIAGVEFDIIKNLKLDAKIQILTAYEKGLTFRPIQTEYLIAVKYAINNIMIKYEHMCSHPTKYAGSQYFEIYGGYDKIGVYWRLKHLY